MQHNIYTCITNRITRFLDDWSLDKLLVHYYCPRNGSKKHYMYSLSSYNLF